MLSEIKVSHQKGQGDNIGPCLTRKRRIQTGDGALCSQYLLAKEGAPPGAGGGLTQGRWPRPLPAPPPAPSLGGGLLTGWRLLPLERLAVLAPFVHMSSPMMPTEGPMGGAKPQCWLCYKEHWVVSGRSLWPPRSCSCRVLTGVLLALI